jgi:hypothetical protein
VGRHANGSKRRKKRVLEAARLRIEATLTLARLGYITERNGHTFSIEDFVGHVRLNGAPTAVNWIVESNLVFARLWWEGHVDVWGTISFNSNFAEVAAERKGYDCTEIYQWGRRWSNAFCEAIARTCPYPKHCGRILPDLLARGPNS